MSELIDHFDLKSGWSKAPDPLGDYTDFDAQVHRLSFGLFASYGDPSGCPTTALKVYDRHVDDLYMVCIDTMDSYRIITATGLPSLVELLRLLSPMVHMGIVTSLTERALDIAELLVGHEGPLAEADWMRARMRRARLEKQERGGE